MTQLVLYDILGGTSATSNPFAFAPNSWVLRYALNFKGLKYHTEWIEYPDVEPTCKSLGVPPTDVITFPSGTTQPFYTLPVLHDPTTNTTIPDSLAIIAYLDKTYPDTPSVLGAGTGMRGLYGMFRDMVEEEVTGKIYVINLAPVVKLLNERSAEYYRKTRVGLEEINPVGSEKDKKLWEDVEASLKRLGMWYDLAAQGYVGMGDDGGEKGETFIAGGNEAAFPDLFLASRLLWVRIALGETGVLNGWVRLKELDGGRWGRLLENVHAKYGGTF
ncbi:hypothetical protein BXZ70DRAFT_544347 [Cristinia sonorae]|uniref:GST N-terminal domain-containing protein n=1 Tax=Cristinia sonorae TaxID=1940300 RepID=A0A8K0XL86_9AGAR|nr:hypothetical protein BXZ70DRAFT_544347 [Cristinia sonorae]